MIDNEQIRKASEQFCDAMMEHGESVRVFVTYRQEGNTAAHTTGRGNFYAQYGQVREWQLSQDQCIKDNASKTNED